MLLLGLRPFPDLPGRLRVQAHGRIVQVVDQRVAPDETIGILHLPGGSFLSGRSPVRRILPLRLGAGDPEEWLREIQASGVRWVAVSARAERSRAMRFLRTLEEKGKAVVCVYRSPTQRGVHLYRMERGRLVRPRAESAFQPPAPPLAWFRQREQ